MRKVIFIIGCISFLTWGGVRIYKKIVFTQNCKGYLKLAADANTVNLAKQQLAKAVSYCEDNGLTQGFTSIIYKTPNEDVGFWYSNLKASLEELEAVPENATPLEKSNVLMKLRETLLDNDKDGTIVTYPTGIQIYGSNVIFMLWGVISILIVILSIGKDNLLEAL